MSSPVDGPIDARVELLYDGLWNDVSVDAALESADITVVYGQPDLHGSPTPTEISLVLDNVDYESADLRPKYSPSDPRSTLFGKIGIGTLMRVRIGDPQPGGLSLPGHRSGYVSTPDAAALDITGDIDIRMELEPDTWRPVADAGLNPSADFVVLARKDTAGYPVVNQVSWVVYLSPTGLLLINWSTTGGFGGQVGATSTAAVPADSGRLAVRVTLDVVDGANKTVRFYTADAIAGPWTQLGADVTTAGNTSIFASSSPLEIGRGAYQFDPSNVRGLRGQVWAFELRDGIDGTLVADINFADSVIDPADREVIGDDGLTWTLQGGAAVVDYSIRGSCAIAKFTPTWDETGTKAQLAIRAYGPLEGQDEQDPIGSAFARNMLGIPTLVAYWPMEDGSDATALASAVAGHQPMSIEGDVALASYSAFEASSPLPAFNSPPSGISAATAMVPFYEAETRQRLVCIVGAPENGVSVDSRLLTHRTTGTVNIWTVSIDTAGGLRLVAFNNNGTTVIDTGYTSWAVNGVTVLVSLLLEQDGASIDWQLARFEAGDNSIGFDSGTVAGTVGRFIRPQVGPVGTLSGTAVGHIGVLNGETTANSTLEIFNLFEDALRAWSGDNAGDRVSRIAAEENIHVQMIGGHDSTLLGTQLPSELLPLLDEAVVADGAFFGERRDANAYQARFRETLYTQTPALVLDMDEGHIINPFDPPLDTSSVRNDITVTRRSGSSYRAVQETGPLSVQAPPNGIGKRRKENVTLNLLDDNQVRDQATWRLYLGTVNEHRIARLEIEMEHHPDLVDAVLRLQTGDIIQIDNAPRGLPPSNILLMALGTADTITQHQWRVSINCAPGSPWTVGSISDGTDEQRVDTDGSTVYAAFTSGTDTELLVATEVGPTWTEDATEFPLDVTAGGVVLTVTDISTAELAPNGTFETDVDGWSALGGTFTHSTAQARTGTGSGLQTPDGVTAVVRARTGDVIAVSPAREYTFTAWVRSADGYTVDTSVFFRDAAGSLVEFEQWSLEAIAADVWTELTTTRVAPAGAVTAQLNINQRDTPAVTDLLWIDDVSFTGPVQTFTVTQTPVNGVEKDIPVGADVRLTHPMIIGL